MKHISYIIPCLRAVLFKSVVILATLISFWVGTAYAYTASGLYVNGYGNIGFAEFSQVGDDRTARTYTSQPVAYVQVNARHWHFILEWEERDEKFGTTSTLTVGYATGTWGADVSHHKFTGISGVGSDSYFLTPIGTTTYSWWLCGNSSC